MSTARDRMSRTGHPGRAIAASTALRTTGGARARRDEDATGEHRRESDRLGAIRDALTKRDLSGLDGETQSLLLHKLAIARAEAGRHADALEIGRRIVALGALPALGHHEIARAHAALGAHAEAAASDRLAARAAAPEERAFFWWSSATHHEHAGDPEQALDALKRAQRWAKDGGRALFRAHAAAIQLEQGQAVPGVMQRIADLAGSPQRDGYGRYMLGRLGAAIGDPTAAAHLRAFLRKHASSSPAVRTSLAWELADARARLRRLGATSD